MLESLAEEECNNGMLLLKLLPCVVAARSSAVLNKTVAIVRSIARWNLESVHMQIRLRNM